MIDEIPGYIVGIGGSADHRQKFNPITISDLDDS
jgi:hypothetical protein